jgi:helicase
MNPESIVDNVLKACGFSELNPVQHGALKAGILDGDNLVVAAPTASGKTLVAEIAMVKAVMTGKKALYIVPLKALASEKYNEFREKYEKLGYRIAISVGDKDSSDPWLAGFDIIIVTSEKLDSLIRHGAPWLDSVGLVVADEIHLIDSPNRGPTLEVILTRLRQLINPQILALSATINNFKELAEWLGAKALKSDYRPVKLYNGLFLKGKIDWHPKKPALKLGADMPPVFEIAKDTVQKGKQSLIFVSTRKRAESLAEKMGDVLRPHINPQEKHDLVKASYDISHALEHPTRQCDRLAKCLQRGAVFHHAGLVAKQRKIIEDNFRSGLIKIICATPTLAMGVNLPSFRVVVRDLKRFSSFRGMDYIPVLEIQQMMGRAGRPAFDSEGEAILIAASSGEAKKLWKEYIHGDPEKIISKLGVEPVLRMHVLSLIATEHGTTKESLMDFFSKTFYAFQYKDMTALEREMEKVLETLAGFNFIKRGGSLEAGEDKYLGDFKSASSLVKKDDEEIKPTRIGKRVAELYIDPLTANHIIESLQKMHEQGKTDPVSVLHVISRCLEMRPGLSVRKKDMENEEGSDTLLDFLVEQHKNLLGKIPEEWDIEYDDFLRDIKLTWMFKEWMQEVGEDALLENFGVTPGELRARLEISDWLFYSMQELGLLLNMHGMLRHIRKARLRIKYGIKEELLALVKLKQVGRVRARMLFDRGYKTIDSLRHAPVTSIAQIVGPNIGKDIKRQLSGLESEKGKARQESLESNPESSNSNNI